MDKLKENFQKNELELTVEEYLTLQAKKYDEIYKRLLNEEKRRLLEETQKIREKLESYLYSKYETEIK